MTGRPSVFEGGEAIYLGACQGDWREDGTVEKDYDIFKHAKSIPTLTVASVLELCHTLGMIRHGEAPYLECSSKGDKRFSAFYAKVNGVSIEECYQAKKIFEDGSTGLSWLKAKGRKAINQEDCAKYYSFLWDEYIRENPELLEVLKKASGLSDIFGQPGHVCQATELWRIRNEK